MGIRSFLGLAEKPSPATETDAVRKVVEALDHLEEPRARFIAAFGYILGRVAHADLTISPAETAAMERLVSEHAQLPADQAMIVVQMAKSRNQLFGGTENFLVTREFDKMAAPEDRLALLDCLYAVAAAEGHISQTEDNEIRRIASELRIEHPDVIAVRSRYRDQLSVFQGLAGEPKPDA